MKKNRKTIKQLSLRNLLYINANNTVYAKIT